MVSEVDGSNARQVHVGVYFDGGLSWSPDGSRIAFIRGDGTQSSVVLADIDGLDEEVVFDESIRTLAPRWSPDGQRIAFHTIDDEGKHRAYVAGATGEPVANPAAQCRPRGTRGVTAGFPLPDWAPSATGTVRVAVLFMDFPDAQASHTTYREAALGLPWAETYLEAASYGRLDVEFVPHHEWLRASNSYWDYSEEGTFGSQISSDAAYREAVDLADDAVDFSGFDSLALILPSSHFSGGVAGGSITADGASMRRHINNVFPRDEPTEPVEWGTVAAHELAHNLGLLDMYPYDSTVHAQPDPPGGREWIPVSFGLMSLDAYFLADVSRMLRRTTRNIGGGGYEWLEVGTLSPHEMLAWSRWQLGWLDRDRVRCIRDDSATVTLAAIADPGDAVAMAAVPINRREVIVIESRRKLGYDLGHEFKWRDGGTGRQKALITEGVLVYTVDSSVHSGDLPVRIAGDSGNGQVDGFPVLEPGESVTLHGYTITVTADNGSTHTVSIVRDPSTGSTT